MTVNRSNVNINTASWNLFFTRFNEVLTDLRTVILTANSITTGNSGVSELFTANVLQSNTANVISVFSNTITSNTANVINISSSNAEITLVTANSVNANTVTSNTANVISVFSNTVTSNTANVISVFSNTVTSNTMFMSGVSYNTISANLTSNTIQLIDSIPITNITTAEYSFAVKDNNANNNSFSKLSVLSTDGYVQSTEYSMLNSNNVVGIFSTSSNTTHLLVQYTPATSNNINIKANRIIIKI